MIHSFWLGSTKPVLCRRVAPGRLRAGEVVHPLPGHGREPHPVVGVAEDPVGVGGLGEELAVVERVDEARRPREVGEAVGLVGPFRRADRVVAAGVGAGREADLPEPRPGRRALGRAVEVVAVAAHRVDRVEEGDPLLHRHLELAEAVAVFDPADREAFLFGLRDFGAGAVDRVRERQDPDRGVAGGADRHGLEVEDRGPGRGGREGGQRQRRERGGGQGDRKPDGRDAGNCSAVGHICLLRREAGIPLTEG